MTTKGPNDSRKVDITTKTRLRKRLMVKKPNFMPVSGTIYEHEL